MEALMTPDIDISANDNRRRTITIRTPEDAYIALVTDLISDAINTAIGRIVSTDCERAMAIDFLRDSKCRRWCEMIGFDWRWIGPAIEARIQEVENDNQ